MTVDTDDEQPFLGYEISQGRGQSEASAAQADARVQQLLRDRYDYTHRCLTESRAALDKLAAALMEHETVTQPDMEKILGARS
jgi:cell division protease FtsH